METQVSNSKFATTFRTGFQDPRFAARAREIRVSDRLDNLQRRKFYFLDEIKLFFRVLQASLEEHTLLLFSSRGYLKPELLAIAFISLWPKRYRPVILFYGEMFESDTGIRGLISRSIIKLADRAINCYLLYSQAECQTFSNFWGIDKKKPRFCHFYRNLEHDVKVSKQTRDQHIFAGGNSFRNYEPFVQSARLLPEYEFVICTNRLSNRDDLPSNIRAGLVSHEEFVMLMNSAGAVVVPLRQDTRRIAGLLVYLESMWLKKPTIVSDALGVCEYVEHGVTGLVVDGTPESYVDAIRWVMDPKNDEEIEHMCERAHKAVGEQFTLENYITRLLEIIDDVLEE